MSETDRDHRAEEAFRAAVGLYQPGVEIDPVAIRHRHRVRRSVSVVIATAVGLAVAGGAITLGQWLPQRVEIAGPQVSSSPSAGLPSGPLRTVYYRDIGFDVPADWTFGDEHPWCGERQAVTDGYVQLGGGLLVPRPACLPGQQPKAPAVDHVVVVPAAESVVASTTYSDGWWTSVRRVGEVKIRAVARERATALALVGSASVRSAGCAPHSDLEVDSNARPGSPFDLAAVDRVGAVTLCQYDVTGRSATSGLRAVTRMEGKAAADALTAFRSAPVDRRTCAAAAHQPLDVAIVVQLSTTAGERELYVRIGTCAGGEDFGVDTVDDGTSQRRLTQGGCAALEVEPVEVSVLTGDAAQVC